MIINGFPNKNESISEHKWLVASDLDGTLLSSEDDASKRDLPDSLFTLLDRIHSKGVVCCIASGRAASSLFTLFERDLDNLYFASENGAQIYKGQKLLEQTFMPREECRKLALQVSERDDCVLRINTTVAKYFLVKHEEVAEKMRNWTYADPYIMTTAYSFDEVEGDITQMTASSFEDIHPIAEELIPIWKDTLQPTITGEYWLDFTTSGKGGAIEKLCRKLKISPKHVVAFGDNYNDASMLDLAGRGYIMDWAEPDLKAGYKYTSTDVIDTLNRLLDEGYFD